VNELKQFKIEVDVYDPIAERELATSLYNLSLITDIHKRKYQLIILAVAHNEFLELDFSILKYSNTVLFDTRSVLNRDWVDGRL